MTKLLDEIAQDLRSATERYKPWFELWKNIASIGIGGIILDYVRKNNALYSNGHIDQIQYFMLHVFIISYSFFLCFLIYLTMKRTFEPLVLFVKDRLYGDKKQYMRNFIARVFVLFLNFLILIFLYAIFGALLLTSNILRVLGLLPS